jgi:hypothetical protein
MILVIVRLLLVGILGFCVWLFWVQNSARVVLLSFDLGVLGAWELTEPVMLPQLLLITAGSGLLLGWIMVLPRYLRQSSKVRSLERNQSFGFDQDDTAS